jgi:hypothetical protein
LSVAIFGETIWAFWRRPQLTISILNGPPDCTKTFFDDKHRTECYFFRLAVANEGKRIAHDVEVYAERLDRRLENNVFAMVQEFPPMDLLWSHIRTTHQDIAPGVKKYCDLGYVAEDSTRLEERIAIRIEPVARFCFELQVKPNHQGWQVGAGVFTSRSRAQTLQ